MSEVVVHFASLALRYRPPRRHKDRDAEVVGLRDEILSSGKQRSFGEIRNLIKGRWPRMQNGKPLTDKAVEAAYKRAKAPPRRN